MPGKGQEKKYGHGYEPDVGTFEAVQVSLGQVVMAVEELGKRVTELVGVVKMLEKRLSKVEIALGDGEGK